MSTFRPSVRVRLQLRIDELDDQESLKAQLEREPPEGAAIGAGTTASQQGTQDALNANQERRTQIQQNRAKIPEPQRERELSQLNKERAALQNQSLGGTVQEKPISLIEDPDDERNIIFSVLPLEVEIARNTVKDADTATITIDFRDVPVDPRIIRACLVTVTVGLVDADEFEAGVTEQKLRDDGSLFSIVDRNPGQELSFQSTTRYIGFAEEWNVDFTDDGDTIKIMCRDVSGLLRDQKLPEGRGIDMNLPIAQGVEGLLNSFSSLRGLLVKFGTPVDEGDPLEVLVPDFGPVPSESIPEAQKSRKGKQAKAKRRGNQRQSVWDHLLDVCNKLGLVPSMRGFTLFLLEPRVLSSNLRDARRMVWGRNIKRLGFARKMGGVKSDTIEVRSFDASIGRTRWARYPVLDNEPSSGILGKEGSPQPVVSRPNDVSPNGSPQEQVLTYFVGAVSDLETLERIAQNTFNEISRQEIEGSLETDEVDSFDSQREGDLLDLQPGEAVRIDVAPPAEVSQSGASVEQKPSNTTSNLQELQNQSIATRAAFLQSLGVGAETAQRLAAAQESVALISTFRAGHVNLSWSIEEGIAMDFDFTNFVVIRDNPDEGTDTTQTPETLDQAADSPLLSPTQAAKGL